MRLRDFLEKARKEKKALFQFSFSSFEQFQSFAEFSSRFKAPLILGLSEGGTKLLGLDLPLEWRDYFRRKLGALIFLNLDHGHTLGVLEEAIELGFDMVHFDAHRLSWGKALSLTQALVEKAHKKDVLVEGETERIKGESGLHSDVNIMEKDLTQPERALIFCQKTKVDLFAPNIGTIHGISQRMPPLRLDLLKELSFTLPCFLALHGGSGYDKKELRKALRLGVSKINIGTALRLHFNSALLQEIQKGEVKPYKYFLKAKKSLLKGSKYYLPLSIKL